jgi:hypothetical protein
MIYLIVMPLPSKTVNASNVSKLQAWYTGNVSNPPYDLLPFGMLRPVG